jgi:hypothetical protein
VDQRRLMQSRRRSRDVLIEIEIEIGIVVEGLAD